MKSFLSVWLHTMKWALIITAIAGAFWALSFGVAWLISPEDAAPIASLAAPALCAVTYVAFLRWRFQ